MTSSNGNIFGVTDPMCAEFTGLRWIPRTQASDADVFFDLRLIKRQSKHSRGWWFVTLSHPLWRHCNVIYNPPGIFSKIRISKRGQQNLLWVSKPSLIKDEPYKIRNMRHEGWIKFYQKKISQQRLFCS